MVGLWDKYIRAGGRCVFAMHVHLVFVTNFRHPVFKSSHLERMEEIMGSVCSDFECELVEFNGESNHVHLMVNFTSYQVRFRYRGC